MSIWVVVNSALLGGRESTSDVGRVEFQVPSLVPAYDVMRFCATRNESMYS